MGSIKELFAMQNITSIIALTAIVSPIFVAIINGIFSTVRKHMDLKHQQHMKMLETYYDNGSKTFSKFLDSIGRFLVDSQTDNAVFDVLSYLYQSYIYADKHLAELLSIFYGKLDAWNNNPTNENLLDDCQQYAIIVAKDINRIILEYTNLKKCFNKQSTNKAIK